MRKREAKRKQKEEQLNWIKSLINEEWHEDTRDWSQASTSPEREDQKINNIKTEEGENSSIYKNYIYRGKIGNVLYAAQKITVNIIIILDVKEFTPRIDRTK